MTLDIAQRELKTLKDFYTLMEETRAVRFACVNSIFDGNEDFDPVVKALKNALVSLEQVPVDDGRRVMTLDGYRTMQLDLDYEIEETKKDIFFLEQGEPAFIAHLAELHPGFDERVAEGRDLLSGCELNSFITDRDGTVNNYCGRYRSSIQSIYNAVFLTRFAMNSVKNGIILTSAPLADPGLVDVSVNPEGAMFYAASKGRECLDRIGRMVRFPVDDEKQTALDRLNSRLSEMVDSPEYEMFSLIGSGLQYKFGQTTVARQDISKSISEEESQSFLAAIELLVDDIDPYKKNFRIEDTGLDVEIILTIETSEIDGEGDGLKDFDKGDGVKFLNAELGLDMHLGTNLICGDTGSDAPMVEAAMELCADTRAIFVTDKPELKRRILSACPDSVIMPEPDMLVTTLGMLG